LILKISGIVMLFQAIIGSFTVVFWGLSLISMLDKRNEMREQLLSLKGTFSFVIFGLLLITSIVLFVCAMKSFNTYDHYLIPGGNNQYLIPSRLVLILGALMFLTGFTVRYTPNGSTSLEVLLLTISAGWVLALLNLILVKKDREERAKEEAENERKF
jgi:hypothetical protein